MSTDTTTAAPASTLCRRKRLTGWLQRAGKSIFARTFLFGCTLALVLPIFLSLPAHAGNIYFGLSHVDNTLTLTNHGNATAFYPSVLHLLDDGRWQALNVTANTSAPVELLAGASLTFSWPANASAIPSGNLGVPSLQPLKPVMVRFFDQAGSGFGQISFFNQPAMATETLDAKYVGGLMTITVPAAASTIRHSWLLWPQENGIAPLRNPVHTEQQQPDARHINWQPGMEALRVDLGAGQPNAMLLHQTAQGYALQSLPDGGLQGRQQRTPWLNASHWLFWLAAGLLAGAALALAWHALNLMRKRSVA